MQLKKYGWFILAFIVASFFGGIIQPYVPNIGNPTLQYVIGTAIPAIVLLWLWEKFFRKQAEGTA